jgi:hypothetical protein
MRHGGELADEGKQKAECAEGENTLCVWVEREVIINNQCEGQK